MLSICENTRPASIDKKYQFTFEHSTAMAADQFCLRWNNFQSNIVTALDSLKSEEDLVDVTLVCEEHSVKAHKVILSACSPYFRNVFKVSTNQENPCQHPVVILKDVSAEDVEALLSFMYQGEVYIGQERLSSFLRTAELLQPVNQSSSISQMSPIPALRPTTSHRVCKSQRLTSSPPPLSVLPTSLATSRQVEMQPKRRKAVPRRVTTAPVDQQQPQEEVVVTKQEPLDEEDMGLCHEEDLKPELSDEDDSRAAGITTSASQSPQASDESTSMLARSLTAPRNSDASGSHSPLQNSLLTMDSSAAAGGMEQLSPGSVAGSGGVRPVSAGLPRVAQGGTCPHCGQEYANQSSLKYHVRLVHSEMTDRACCHLCPLSFRTRESFKLKQHMKEAHNVHY
ncbi:hypothetical protein B566_EDAN008374 [Ephemera danica]|nr:hypothetical protein B566_EDAN008374 [Ephemera danica]